MFGITSQTSGLGLRQSSSIGPRGRSSGRGHQLPSQGSGGGRRKPTLTLTDLESQGPFESLRNIDKPSSKVSAKHDDHWASMPTTRVSFISTTPVNLPESIKSLAADVKRTQEPMTSSVPKSNDVKRTQTQELMMSSILPTHTTQETVTSSVPRYPDVKRTVTREPMTSSFLPPLTTQEPVMSSFQRYADVKRTQEPKISSFLPAYTTQEPMLSSFQKYTDVKRTSAQEPVTSTVPRYTEIKPRTLETVTSSACEPTGAAAAPGSIKYCPGNCSTVCNRYTAVLLPVVAEAEPRVLEWDGDWWSRER